MYSLLKYPIFSLSILSCIESRSQTIPVQLDPRASHQVEAASRQINAATADSSYEIQTLGNDPHIYSSVIKEKYDPDSVYIISFDYLAPKGLDNIQIYFGPPFSEANSLRIGSLPAASVYTTFNVNIQKHTGEWNKAYSRLRFDIGKSANQKISIKNINLRKPEASEIDYRSINKNKEIVDYISTTFTSKIQNVIVNKDKIIIRGNVSTNQANVYLCELRMFDETKMIGNSFGSVTPLDTRRSTFQTEIKRFVSIHDTGYDRIYSRWVLASKDGNSYKIQSAASYAQDITNAAYQYVPEEKPVNKKGLGGFVAVENTITDLIDLGIKNVTVNVVLPSLLSLSSTEYAFTQNGHTYYFNPAMVNVFDKTFKTCRDNDVVVSVILLIPLKVAASQKLLFVHPNANAGVQSMANITSLTGLNYYAAAIGFLAERYGRPDNKFGRIANWIIHNEVDNGQYWANAGSTQLEDYTELYDRAMRTAYYTVRQYNPAGKVFLSLTHFWAGTAKAIYFSPKKMLETFNSLSRKQGDYEWGIAYHPYPENAFDPKSWKDKNATNDINTTKYITPKNIELIDTWMRMRSHLYKGLKVRTLLFSEQGVHSGSNNKNDLMVQAAGLAYMWKKIERLPTLEAFHYHHQTDNLDELGLMLGLRTAKPGTKGTPDQKKPAWDVYQKAGTSSEDNAFAFALPIIGISNWSEIFNPLKGEVMPLSVTFNITDRGKALDDVSIYFNGEMHKTINGKATFYNVASLSTNRIYRLIKNGRSIWPAQRIVINKDQIISVDVSRK